MPSSMTASWEILIPLLPPRRWAVGAALFTTKPLAGSRALACGTRQWPSNGGEKGKVKFDFAIFAFHSYHSVTIDKSKRPRLGHRRKSQISTHEAWSSGFSQTDTTGNPSNLRIF